VVSGGITRLCDERELRVERQGDVTDQAAKELVSDRTGGSLRNGAEQIPAAGSRTGALSLDVRRQEAPPRRRW
jgi:hypothetical protein